MFALHKMMFHTSDATLESNDKEQNLEKIKEAKTKLDQNLTNIIKINKDLVDMEF